MQSAIKKLRAAESINGEPSSRVLNHKSGREWTQRMRSVTTLELESNIRLREYLVKFILLMVFISFGYELL